jgi:hypothetical protein
MSAPMAAAAAAGAGAKFAGNKYAPIIMGVVIIGAGVGLYFLTRPALEFAGIIATKEERKIKKSKALDPTYWKKKVQNVTISTSKAFAIARGIHTVCDACRGNIFGDTLVGDFASGLQSERAEQIAQLILRAGSNVNMSKVSDVFQKEYGKKLSDFLEPVGNTGSEAIYAALQQVEKN